jgi:hypothetical protein
MANLFKKAAICTDIHFGLKSNSQTHNDDCLNFIRWFTAKAKQEGCDIAMFLGDWHNNRASINSFTRVLNIEKRNQNIRDDILEMNNYNPSYTRQNEWGGGH